MEIYLPFISISTKNILQESSSLYGSSFTSLIFFNISPHCEILLCYRTCYTRTMLRVRLVRQVVSWTPAFSASGSGSTPASTSSKKNLNGNGRDCEL